MVEETIVETREMSIYDFFEENREETLELIIKLFSLQGDFKPLLIKRLEAAEEYLFDGDVFKIINQILRTAQAICQERSSQQLDTEEFINYLGFGEGSIDKKRYEIVRYFDDLATLISSWHTSLLFNSGNLDKALCLARKKKVWFFHKILSNRRKRRLYEVIATLNKCCEGEWNF